MSLDRRTPSVPRHRPRRRFGQHFLEAPWADKVLEAISPSPEDHFIEIGPGAGALTVRLAPRIRRLTAFEIDRDLAARLRTVLPANAEVIAGDFLDADLGLFVTAGPVRVAGNLPYNISSPILFKLLESARRLPGIRDATLMLQEEVADRLTARVGTKEYGVLTIFTGLQADVSRLLRLPPGAFRPAPRVDSTLVQLTFHAPRVEVEAPRTFDRMVRAIYTQRRKTLLNALRPVAHALGRDPASALSAAEIDGSRRPETLGLGELARLANVLGG